MLLEKPEKLCLRPLPLPEDTASFDPLSFQKGVLGICGGWYVCEKGGCTKQNKPARGAQASLMRRQADDLLSDVSAREYARLSVRPSVRPSVCLSVCLFVCLRICLSVYLPLCVCACVCLEGPISGWCKGSTSGHPPVLGLLC